MSHLNEFVGRNMSISEIVQIQIILVINNDYHVDINNGAVVITGKLKIMISIEVTRTIATQRFFLKDFWPLFILQMGCFILQ